jgi:hypothetical protein
MQKAEVDQLLKALDEKHREDRKAILRVQQLLEEEIRTRANLAVMREFEKLASPAKSTGPSNFSQVVRDAVESLSGQFSTHDVRDAVQKMLPDFPLQSKMASISSVLLGLLEDKKIKLIQKGIGAKPSVYER